MKKFFAVAMAVLLLAPLLSVLVAAVPLSAGTTRLQQEFSDGTVTGGNDYVSFSPVKSAFDTKKYPLIVWLHGGGDYSTPRSQIEIYDVANLACDEYQAQFTNAGGCFVLAPRDAGVLTTSWEVNDVGTLKNTIDVFIQQNSSHIDTNRIYLIGYSTGASMVWNMLAEYPNFFAAAIPASALIQPTSATISTMTDTSIWIFSSDVDPYPSARSSAAKTVFNGLRTASGRLDGLRFTTFSEVVLPDGTKKNTWDEEHYTWLAITHNMRMNSGNIYANTTTIDGNGNTVSFSDNSGVFDWLSRQSRTGVVDEDINTETPFVNPFATMIAIIQNVLGRLLDLLKQFLGLA